MSRSLADYPLRAFVDGAATVWGRFFMIYLALNLPLMVWAVVEFGRNLLSVRVPEVLLAFLGGPFVIAIGNLTTGWGLLFNVAIAGVVLSYFFAERYSCERFFAMSWLAWGSWGSAFGGFGVPAVVAAILLAALHGGVRLWVWYRMRQLERMTTAPAGGVESAAKGSDNSPS